MSDRAGRTPQATLPTPFAGLTPDAVMDAAEALGLEPDGRQFALNSYENRVYRVGRTDAAPVVIKFYRTGRWSDQQILEEHQFALELAEQEIPVAAPMLLGGTTLHRHAGFRLAVFPLCAGTAPELDRAGLPSITSESRALARELKRRGWRFVGPTTVYAFMQAMGLVNDHLTGCQVRARVQAARESFTRP